MATPPPNASKTAQRLVTLCLRGRAPATAAFVTRDRAMRPASLEWRREERFFLAERLGAPGDAEGFMRELRSEKARRFWACDGMPGRLRALCGCTAFQSASVVDAVALFLAVEECIRPAALRKVFRYVFGVGDAEFYAAVRELVRGGNAMIASVRPDDEMGVGPFVLLPAESGRECWFARHGDDGTLFWYDLYATDAACVEALLMRLFLECADDLDDNPCANGAQIQAYAALGAFYHGESGTIDGCYPYVRELLEIGSRETCDLRLPTDDARYMRNARALEKEMTKNRAQILNDTPTQPPQNVYIPPQRQVVLDMLGATKDDCDRAHEVLCDDIDSLRRDAKSGKTIHAEILRHVLEEIPKVFPLKSLYRIFEGCDIEGCDMEPEEIRRNVRELCAAGAIVMAGRGIYCSIACADQNFIKYPKYENKSEADLLNEVLKEQIEKLEQAVGLLDREVGKIGK